MSTLPAGTFGTITCSTLFERSKSVAPAGLAIGWGVVRILAAVVTVPLAEELAFRAFLIRRLIASDFLSLSPRTFTLFSVVASSLAFGSLHGSRWLIASVAGVLYSWLFVRRGRVADAVVAHAITNALLAIVVLRTGDWGLW